MERLTSSVKAVLPKSMVELRLEDIPEVNILILRRWLQARRGRLSTYIIIIIINKAVFFS